MLLHSIADKLARRRLYVFLLFWVITFIIYLPAAHAGFVSDTTGWLQSVREDSFADYINRSRFHVKSMYQFTQLITWVLYQLIGVNHWAWHLLFVTLHAVDCLLLYIFCNTLFTATGIEKGYRPALAGAVLFCVSPYASEVVVWEASYHYLQAFICMFSILILVQRFQEMPSGKKAFIAGVIFFVATFTHELWYLILPFTFLLALYYRIGLNSTRAVFRKTLLYFTLPQVLFFVIHLWMFRLVYGGTVAHVGGGVFKNPPDYFYVKMPWYFFHLFTWGRFFPHSIRHHVYDIFHNPFVALAFYLPLALLCGYILLRFRRMPACLKAASFLFVCLLFAIGIYVPLWFPELLLVVCDRYTYIMLAFQWTMVALILYHIPKQWLQQGLWILLLGVNLYLVLSLSRKWQRSDEVISAIQTSPVLKPGKVKILLNSPACLRGIPMIGSSDEGEFRLMHNLLFEPPIKDSMLEVAAYNMEWPENGAHAEVMNDSTIKVTLNQWGTWWWLGSFGASSYENHYYRLDMTDPGHQYNVILKKPYDQYQVIFQTGKELKEVDMQRKGEQN